jgi:subtilase family serine protease
MPFWSKIEWTKGTFNFTATADATSLVAESNEGNNVTNSSMTR